MILSPHCDLGILLDLEELFILPGSEFPFFVDYRPRVLAWKRKMQRNILLIVLLLIIVITQITILSTFFHSFQASAYAQNNSIVEIGKMTYVAGWASIDITGPSTSYPATIHFVNGTQVSITSEYTFTVRLPRSGDCYCNGATGLPGTNIYVDQIQPIRAAVISNASDFQIGALAQSGIAGFYETYWYTITGYASITITGYGVSY